MGEWAQIKAKRSIHNAISDALKVVLDYAECKNFDNVTGGVTRSKYVSLQIDRFHRWNLHILNDINSWFTLPQIQHKEIIENIRIDFGNLN